MKKIILLGGGIDSTALLLSEISKKTELHALFFDYGQKASVGEISSVKYFCKKYDVPLKILKIPINKIASCSIMKGEDKNIGDIDLLSNVLEFRNGIFIAFATTYATSIGAQKILLGYHIEPENTCFPDADKPFIFSMQTTIDAGINKNLDVEIECPFLNLERHQILELGYKLDKDIVKHSFTCYESLDNTLCEKCAHCLQLKTNIEKINLKEDINK